MTRAPGDLTPTPGQTVGPFFGYALPYAGDAELVPPGRADAVRLFGRVLDGAGRPVPDALVEIWQPGPDGTPVQEPGSLRRDGFTFTGWGRAGTDDTGTYSFSTLPPPAYWSVCVFARGLLDRLLTRAYLPDHADDALLAALAPERRATLRTRAEGAGYRFDIRLQGDAETVFLTFPRS